jgi:hypothetical protein
MPEEGTYLLSHVGFTHSGEPTLSLGSSGIVQQFNPIGHTLSIRINKDQRYCTGWHNLQDSTSHSCPDSTPTDSKYDQCPACQQRTGFNPAFYNASSVSAQQEEVNQEPHILYLAHFGPGITKVGISRAKRNQARLLEQGARSAAILDTLPTALIARQYEAKIAALSGIAETLQVRKKIVALQQPYDQSAAIQELANTKARIETALGTAFPASKSFSFHDSYFPGGISALHTVIDVSVHYAVSGKVVGMLGPFLISEYQNELIFLPLKKYTGYQIELSNAPIEIPLPSQQMSFF